MLRLLAAAAVSAEDSCALAGCCCCAGACIFDGCPPCPCPPPPPSQPPPTCSLQSLLDRYDSTYTATANQMLQGSTATDPDKTVLDAAGRFAWHLSDGWRSGFFPGLLWQLASHGAAASRALYAQAAARFTAGREHRKSDTSTHDVGFMIFDSFGAGLRLDGKNQSYRQVIAAAAHALATRFSATVGMTRSWGRVDDEQQFEVRRSLDALTRRLTLAESATHRYGRDR